jgi:hypothetical protein
MGQISVIISRKSRVSSQCKSTEDNVAVGLPKGWWAYGSFADGSAISRSMRLLYRDRVDLQQAFPKPFGDPEDGLRHWLHANGYR